MGSPSKLQIDQAEQALLALLQATISTAVEQKVDVQSLGSKDFNEEGDLIMSPPSIRMRFYAASYSPLRDNQRLTYEAAMTFEVMCFDESLRSRADSRMKSLALVAAVEDQLAGARLPLADGTFSFPIQIQGVSPMLTETGPIDQLYIVTVVVGGIAQFSGPNANFGGQH